MCRCSRPRSTVFTAHDVIALDASHLTTRRHARAWRGVRASGRVERDARAENRLRDGADVGAPRMSASRAGGFASTERLPAGWLTPGFTNRTHIVPRTCAGFANEQSPRVT